MSGQPRRKSWPFFLALGALCALVPLGYYLFLGRTPPPAPPPPPPPPPQAVVLTLSGATGKVEIRRKDEPWRQATVGEALRQADSVRTSDGASATLTGGEAYQVRMEPGTEVSVGQLTHSISELLLESGMATARVNKSARHLFEVRAAGSDAVARTQDGTFAISNNGKGTVAVGTEEGQVELAGKGKVVIVRAGEESIVHPGRAPSAPAPIPSSLLLKVRWPKAGTLTRRTTIIRGTAEPGAVVDVAGRTVLVDDHGTFAARIHLSEGRNAVEVRAHAVGRRAEDVHHSLLVDTRPPKVRVDKSLWK